jgi:hypothetical protein
VAPTDIEHARRFVEALNDAYRTSDVELFKDLGLQDAG